MSPEAHATRRRPAWLQVLADGLGLLLWRRYLRRRRRRGTLNRFGGSLQKVDPSAITHQIPIDALPAPIRRHREAVGWSLPGDWDLRLLPLAEHAVFQGIRERFEEGRPWPATTLCRTARQGLEEGSPLWKFRTPSDLPRLCAKIDSLHDAIAHNGYRSQRQLGSLRRWDEILVAVDRDGGVHLVDGAHRLALAQVLGLRAVPALVAACHQKWEEAGGDL